MSVSSYFAIAATHAEDLLRERWLGATRPHPLYRNRACELATRALTRAMVASDGTARLRPGEATKAQRLLVNWVPDYQNDVPGRLRTFARAALAT